MLLCLLLSILSATFTVSDKNRVSPSGNLPEGGDFVYARTTTTGSKGQMTAGNSTTLCLKGWDGCTIQSVTLSMRSNSSSGAGRLFMTIGGKLVWRIRTAPFSDDDWNGGFSSAFVNISRNIRRRVGTNEEVKIHIKATENSLYIASYTIRYTPPVPKSYRVCFVSGVGDNPPDIEESAPHSGVILPLLPDTARWHFVGWSETEVSEGTSCPTLFAAHSLYFPRSHCTLYAVYLDAETASEQVSQPESGCYSLVHNSPYWGARALCSDILSVLKDNEIMYHVIETLPVTMDTLSSNDLILCSDISPNMLYRLDFLSDSTLTITHDATNTPVGHKGEDLYAALSVWKYRWLTDNSLMLYFEHKGKLRYLNIGYGVKATLDELVGYMESCLPSTPLIDNGISLFPITSAIYSTWLLGKPDAVENVPSDLQPQAINVPMGIYQLHICNGKKFLRLRTL